jgi:NADPH:quinone reductase-like Zn-dependent oxidoreductase
VSHPQVIPTTMQAIVQSRYGRPAQVLAAAVVPVPTPVPGEVLVRVAASAVNALDWHYTAGEPMFARLALGLRRPKRQVPGADVSGTIVSVGDSVTRWRAGDEVFGVVDDGGFAEFVARPEDHFVARPESLPLVDAAALGVAALTALQGLRDWGHLQPGQSVLINGASGGVGTFAVQIAKALGAGHVTAVCSTRNVEQARSLGADEVLDYTRESVSDLGRSFDLFFDNAGSTTIREARRLVAKGGRYVVVTAPKSRWLKPLPRMLATPLVFLGSGRTAVVGKVSERSTTDLQLLHDWVESGALRPVIEATYPLADGPEVIQRQGEFHATGKTLVVP